MFLLSQGEPGEGRRARNAADALTGRWGRCRSQGPTIRFYPAGEGRHNPGHRSAAIGGQPATIDPPVGGDRDAAGEDRFTATHDRQAILMNDRDCVRFLQAALPELHLRWPGFRRVRRQVCKRIGRRLRELGLPDVAAYEDFLERHPTEWSRLDEMCRITISRFYRDRRLFAFLEDDVVPTLARIARERGDPDVRCWSAGCASGEEPYTLAMVWRFSVQDRFPGSTLRITATDVDEFLLERALCGDYGASSLRELPTAWRSRAFETREGDFRIRPTLRETIEFRPGDIRREAPGGLFDLVLCRNLAFTYFDEARQREVLRRIEDRLRPGGALVIGSGEVLPAVGEGFVPWPSGPGVFRRIRSAAPAGPTEK